MAEDAKSLGVIERILSESAIGQAAFYERIRVPSAGRALLPRAPDLVARRYERFHRIGADSIRGYTPNMEVL